MAMTLVSTVTVGSGGAASIEFTGIPATGKDLLVLLSGRSDYADIWNSTLVRLNSDSGSNYTRKWLYGDGSNAASASGTTTSFLSGYVNGNTSTSNTFGNMAMYFSNYTSSVAKSMSSDAVNEGNATSYSQLISAYSWSGTSAISTITIIGGNSANWMQHSTASLYIIS